MFHIVFFSSIIDAIFINIVCFLHVVCAITLFSIQVDLFSSPLPFP